MKNHSRKFKAFTLTELMISLTLGLALGGAAMGFMIEGVRSSLKSTNNTINDLSHWTIFTAISVDSKIANGMAIYSTFDPTDTTSIDNETKRLGLDQRGNFLVLTRTHQDPNTKLSIYDKITGYKYDPTYKTLRKFEYIVQPSEQGSVPHTLEQILKDNAATLAFKRVAESVYALPFVPPSTDTGSIANGAFLVRSKGKSGILAVMSVNGVPGTTNATGVYVNPPTQTNAQKIMTSKKLIEAAFFIRG